MKKLLLCGGIFLLTLSVSSQTLFTYGKESVSRQEFEHAFLKNHNGKPDDQSVREYLDLYINFKLKVHEAKARRYDTLPALRADLQNFREQIEAFYLKDDKMVNELIREAFDRSQKDIHLITYFIPKNTNTDLAAVKKALPELQRSINKNSASEKLQVAGAPVTKTDVGFVTVFTLPYEYETILYKLGAGQVSEPISSAEGWYLFQNVGERPAAGKVRVAQILISAPDNFPEERKAARKTADSLYRLLQKGADFAVLARENSLDRSSFYNEGILPAFGVGKYAQPFETKAFSMRETGELLPPFETAFGFHILKLISKEPVPANAENTAYMQELGREVAADKRMKEADENFQKQVSQLTGMQKMDINQDALWKITDSALFANRILTVGGMSEETPLLRFNNGAKSTVGSWIMYLKNKGISFSDYPAHMYPALFTEFTQDAAQNQYRLRLGEFNPEFRQQLREFEEGNMLFELMEKEVWNTSAQDSAGLRHFYETNKNHYLWKKSAETTVYTSLNETIASRVREEVKAGKTTEQLLLEFESLLRIDSGRVEISELPASGINNLSVNKISQLVTDDEEETVSFYIVHKLYPANEPKTFEEARGMALPDYQASLEQALLSKLRKKYPVNINQKTLKKLFR